MLDFHKTKAKESKEKSLPLELNVPSQKQLINKALNIGISNLSSDIKSSYDSKNFVGRISEGLKDKFINNLLGTTP